MPNQPFNQDNTTKIKNTMTEELWPNGDAIALGQGGRLVEGF